VTLNELVHVSQHAIVGTPVDLFGQWEMIGKRSRIVTYTLVRAEHSLDGRPPATSEVMIRTLGGVVSDIGQVVPGEAALHRGATAALFIQEASRDLFVVTGMAQGHYPLAVDASGTLRLHATKELVELVGSEDHAAIHALDGRTVAEVETLVRQEMARGAR
jgi:hypothetical protein